ncbi:MAG TPA: hypothetical protein VME41_05505 [Stellaceae bacterium]|nr:hypothetical protein [Stellaceae bacterium]
MTAAALHFTRAFDRAQHTAQRLMLTGPQAEGASNLARAQRSRMAADEFDDRSERRQPALPIAISAAASGQRFHPNA